MFIYLFYCLFTFFAAVGAEFSIRGHFSSAFATIFSRSSGVSSSHAGAVCYFLGAFCHLLCTVSDFGHWQYRQFEFITKHIESAGYDQEDQAPPNTETRTTADTIFGNRTDGDDGNQASTERRHRRRYPRGLFYS